MSCCTLGSADDARRRAGLVGGEALGQARVSRDPEGPREVAEAPRRASVRERASPSFLAAAGARRGVAAGSRGNLLSAELSVNEERARECEDAVDLIRFCDSFPIALETWREGRALEGQNFQNRLAWAFESQSCL